MRHLSSEDKAGLYITAIIHLAVIIVLLLTGIGRSIQKEKQEFLLDFSKLEALERMKEAQQKQEESFDEKINKRLEDMIAGKSGVNFKNIAVDRGSTLKDDRNTDADKLYKDAEKLAQDLKNGITPDEPDEDYAQTAGQQKKTETSKKEYSGPSVVSYTLDGRKASRLPIPAYRCLGGGMVTVIIIVDNAGTVVGAKVQDETSSSDRCLRDFAVRAARLSKFSASPSAPSRQPGNIVYQFIAQ